MDGALTQVNAAPQPSNTLSASSTVRSAAADCRRHPLGQSVRVQDQASQAFDDLLEFQLGDRRVRRPGGI